MLFGNKSKTELQQKGFNYLAYEDAFYFDSSCQTLRPFEVIMAEQKYYTQFNACGHRVKYEWGKIVDKNVDETRGLLLKLTGKSEKDYSIGFCLNTTHGINTILHQLNPDNYEKIVTSEIEHNSVFLNVLTWAKRNNKKRFVYSRTEEGGLIYKKEDLKNAVVIVNTTSNIDGRVLSNIDLLCKDVHEGGGILLLDGAQSFGHNISLLRTIDFDAIFGSGHKMYGPSIGFIIIKKSLLKSLNYYLIGGGTVEDVKIDQFDLVSNEDELYARVEPGLQNFAGIIGLGSAVKWKQSFKYEGMDAVEYEEYLKQYLNKKLLKISDIKLINPNPSSVVSIYSDKIDAHKLGALLSTKQIMCRTGYFCCHYYLKELKKYPPLLRISLGLNNTTEQIDFLVSNLDFVVSNF